MQKVVLRPVRPDDEAFLARVYASVRSAELSSLGWGEAQRASFLEMQASVQRRSWGISYPQMDRALVLVDGAPAGRLYVDRTGDAILLVDIALLPEHRNAGLGARLLRGLLAEAHAAKKAVRLHVERHNRARRLYARLGFVLTSEGEVHCAMERSPVS